MALQVNQTIAQTSDSAARAYNSNVRLSKRALEDLKRVTPVPTIASPEVPATGYVPNAYTLLVSRIENNAAHGAPEMASIEELARMLASKLSRMSERAKHKIAELPEFAAAGITEISALPAQLRARLMGNMQVEPLLVLLKHPVLVSYIKDAQRASLYGPSGMLLAS